uniref:Uncharacterized protein n=1 Tax=Acrobeloides nanus TaxID=290746 RepID=A0A914EHK3_9BILA
MSNSQLPPPYEEAIPLYNPPPSYDEVIVAPVRVTNPNLENGISNIPTKKGLKNDTPIRNAFIRKVFLIISGMMTIWVSMSSLPYVIPFFSPKMITNGNQDILNFTILISIVIYFLLAFVFIYLRPLQRNFPANLIILTTMNLCFAYPLILVNSDVRLCAVFPGLIMLTIFCVGIAIFTIQTKYGLISYVGVICQILIALIAFGIVHMLNIFVLKMEFIVTIYALILLLVGIIYLMISIQLIIHGQRGDITEEDYVFAAVTIFLDIFYAIMISIIFIFIVVVMLFFGYFGIRIVRIPLWRSGNTTTNNDNTTV